MKVEKIAQVNAMSSVAKSRNVNLTGFGQAQASSSEQVSSFNNKKSNEAIRNQFLANVSFEGHKDYIKITEDVKYGRARLLSTSGGFIKELPEGDSGYEYERCTNSYRVERPVISRVYHAELQRGGIRAHGDNAPYVAKEVITESPYYYNGSWIKENSPAGGYSSEQKSVYFSDPGERMDERTPYCDYVVYAPGAYYKERTFWEKL